MECHSGQQLGALVNELPWIKEVIWSLKHDFMFRSENQSNFFITGSHRWFITSGDHRNCWRALAFRISHLQ